jgi:hypothetical protein
MKTEVVVLCEDKAMATFLLRFLKLRGYATHQVRILPVPGRSGGAGEQFVRKQYPAQLTAIRQRQNKALIVMLDADNGTVAGHKQELERACAEAGVAKRTNTEPVVLAVPKRNVETWFGYLLNEPWDEQSDEWKRKKDDLAKPAAEALHQMCYRDQKLREPAPSSLVAACEEWKRMA